MDVGKYDFLLRSNQKMYGVLPSKDYDISCHEFSGAHCNTPWRNDVWDGLESMFGMEE